RERAADPTAQANVVRRLGHHRLGSTRDEVQGTKKDGRAARVFRRRFRTSDFVRRTFRLTSSRAGRRQPLVGWAESSRPTTTLEGLVGLAALDPPYESGSRAAAQEDDDEEQDQHQHAAAEGQSQDEVLAPLAGGLQDGVALV